MSPFLPHATYRLQLTPQHGFAAAAALVPYLADLGVSHLYLSPILKTRPGSPHGYDVIDHESLNPELGGEEQFERLCSALAAHGMGQIVDTVPNHVGVMGSDNAWWLDLLEHGQASRYAEYFDVDWRPIKLELRNKVLVPVLGDQYGNVLVRGELELRHAAAEGELSVYYHEHRFPLDPATYPRVLGAAADALAARRSDAPEVLELESVVRSLEALPPATATGDHDREVRARESAAAKRRLAALGDSPAVATEIARAVGRFAGTRGDPASFAALHDLLEAQSYRLAFWRVAADEINYRRFFDINDLAALRTQHRPVLEATHRRLLEWVRAGRIQGLRIDHPDGLYDPGAYFQWLRQRLRDAGAADAYVVVEKILAAHEHLPPTWPVQGTTGYDFSFLVTALFVHAPSERAFDRVYRDFTGQRDSYEELLYACKREVLIYHLSSELTMLASLLDRITEARIETRDFTLNALRGGLLELIAAFPVYRSYIAAAGAGEDDRRHVDWACARAEHRYDGRDEGVLALIRRLLVEEVTDEDRAYRDEVRRFAAKFQQVTAPVTAKAMEDTCFYRYLRLASLNEVGGEPRRFGVTPAAFHHVTQARAQRWPHSMLGTSTHDSKRSEDVRARLNVLSEMPEQWRERLAKWRRFNQAKRRRLDERPVPSRLDEYLLYQTLVGTWCSPADADALDSYRARIERYVVKAAREAKLRTSWSKPNAEYEERLTGFVADVLAGGPANPFVADLDGFVREIALPGYLNALSQTLLKLASPGVPDTYQGNELWDFSLVDPDNRRSVDYQRRRGLLATLRARCNPGPDDALLEELWRGIDDGRAKLYLTWRVLHCRRERPRLFADGEYVPLEAWGEAADHVCAFARRMNGDVAVVAAGRWFTRLPDWPPNARGTPPPWTSVEIGLPAPGRYRNGLTGRTVDASAEAPRVAGADLFGPFPVALLLRE